MITGFANGIFDLFHDGHAHFLRECKMNCDVLHVALNSDISAGAHKGRLPWKAFIFRCDDVRKYADHVCGFQTEEMLLQIMQSIKPDVIFKGEDYIGKPITGGDLARIHWIARHPGFSSTIERMKLTHPEPIAVEDM